MTFNSIRKNSQIYIGLALALGFVGVMFTNAGSTRISFDEKTLACIGPVNGKMTVGAKADSQSLSDCSRASNLSIRAKEELKSIRGADVFNSQIAVGDTSVSLNAVASNFFQLNAQGTNFEKSDLNKVSFIDSNLDSVSFNAAVMRETEFSKVKWADGRFRGVKYSGEMKDSNLTGFTANDSDFSQSSFSKVSFENSKFFQTNFVGNKVCGELKFDGSYFSRANLEFAGMPSADCSEESLLSFNNADLQYSSLKIEPSGDGFLVDMANAKLQGADLSALDTSKGRWSFKGAQIDGNTKLPKLFPFKGEVVFIGKAPKKGGVK